MLKLLSSIHPCSITGCLNLTVISNKYYVMSNYPHLTAVPHKYSGGTVEKLAQQQKGNEIKPKPSRPPARTTSTENKPTSGIKSDGHQGDRSQKHRTNVPTVILRRSRQPPTRSARFCDGSSWSKASGSSRLRLCNSSDCTELQ